MSTLLWTALALYALNTILNCSGLLFGGSSLRGKWPRLFVVTKILIMPLAFLVYSSLTTNYNFLVVTYIVTSWLGDICLLAARTSIQAVGCSLFALSHISLSISFNIPWRSVPFSAFMKSIPTNFFLLYFMATHLDFHSPFHAAAGAYCAVLMFSSTVAGLRTTLYPIDHPSFVLCFFGYLIFLFSDCLVIRNKLRMDSAPWRFSVMSTYCLAQLMLCCGVAITSCVY